jgi:hypothetical protein
MAARSSPSGIARDASVAAPRARLAFQLGRTASIAKATAIGTQPPLSIFTTFAAKKARSIASIGTQTASARPTPQLRRAYTKKSTVVMAIVPVTAMP